MGNVTDIDKSSYTGNTSNMRNSCNMGKISYIGNEQYGY